MKLNSSQYTLLAKILAKAEFDAFRFHSLARSYKKYNSEYYSFYHKFYKSRVQRDQVLFNTKSAKLRIAAYWFTAASKFHDEAEDRLEAKYWTKVSQALTIYYLIILTILNPSNYQIHFGDVYTTESSKHIYPKNIYDHPLFSKAKKLGYHEMEIWKTHHNRQYSKFKKHSIEVSVGLGCNPDLAKKAAHYLAFASQFHDKAEAIEDRISKKTAKIWRNSYIKLEMYYLYLMQGM